MMSPSTYFEGQALGNPQAQRGYSRDHRPDCKQVCIALVVTFDGFPLGYEVFAGNTHDSRTLQTIVATMEAPPFPRTWLSQTATYISARPSELSGSHHLPPEAARRAGASRSSSCASPTPDVILAAPPIGPKEQHAPQVQPADRAALERLPGGSPARRNRSIRPP